MFLLLMLELSAGCVEDDDDGPGIVSSSGNDQRGLLAKAPGTCAPSVKETTDRPSSDSATSLLPIIPSSLKYISLSDEAVLKESSNSRASVDAVANSKP